MLNPEIKVLSFDKKNIFVTIKGKSSLQQAIDDFKIILNTYIQARLSE